MTWPLSQDFNEAVQNPATTFADPDLKGGQPAVTPLGVPRPRSGNYADVYEFTGPGGQRWAVKCFTRPVAPDLDARYAAIADHLAKANLPFTVGFDFLRQGMRVKGKYYPVVKMPWVDGFPINQFVREHLNRATLLEAMLSLWVRLCRRLRETGMAHCDLQHGNVLLVPAGGKANSLELKLVDYDGMFVPALAGRPTGEAGHAAYQHPERAANNVYSADLDRFPHLVVATALRALLVGGQPLWQKYDNGDNLLFTERDFKAPGQSKLMRELWDTGDPFTVGLLAHLVLACTKPLAQTPWLDQLMPEGRPPGLTPSQERQAATILGVPVAAAAPPPGYYPGYPPPGYAPPLAPPALDFADGRRRRPAASGNLIGVTVLGGLLLIGVLVGVGIVILGSKEPPAETAQPSPPPATAKDDPPAKPPEPTPGATAASAVKPPPSANAHTAATAVARESWAVPLDADPQGVKFAADGRTLIANEQGSHLVHAHDARDGKRTGTFRDLAGATAVTFAPLPGGQVALAGHEPIVLVWSPATGKAERFPVPNLSPPYADLTASRDGRHLLLTGPGRVVVLDFDSPGRVVVNTTTGDVPSAVFSADGTQLLATGPDGAVYVFRLPGGQPVPPQVHLPGVVAQAWANLLAVRPVSGKQVGRELRVVDPATAKSVKVFDGRYEPIPPRFSPDGRFLFAAVGPAVEAWDTTTWQKVATVAVTRGPVAAFDVGPDGRTVVAAADRKLYLFELRDDRFAAKPTPTSPVAATAPAGVRPLKEVWAAAFDVDPERTPRAIRVSPDGSRLVVPVRQAAVTHTFDAATGKRVATLADTGDQPVAAFPLPGGRVFTYQNNAAVARLWAADSDKFETVTVPTDAVGRFDGLSPDGRYALVRRSRDNDYAVLDTRSMRVVPLPDTRGQSLGRMSPDGAAVLVAAGPKAMLFATAEGRRTTTFDLPFLRCGDAALAPDRRTAVLLPAPTAEDPTPPLHVFDVAAGRSVRTIPGPFARGGAAVQFTRDGRLFGAVRLLTPMEGYSFEVFDTAAGQLVARAVEPVGPAFDFGPDGRRVVVWGHDGRLRAYDLPGDLMAAAPARAEPSRPARRPVPDADAAAKADAFVRETYKADFVAKSPADRRKLADKLLREADQTADPAARFAMLRAVEAVAVELSDLTFAAKAIDGLDQDYEFDGPAEKLAVVEKVIAGTTQIPLLKAAAEAALEIAEESADRDEYDRAVQLAAAAAAALGKAGLLTRDAEARQAQLRKLRDEFEPVRRAAEVLKAKPDDPAAALAVGRYRAVAQRRWDDALPLLAAGSDLQLRKLAESDLKAATDTDTTDVARGDAWAEFARSQPEADRPAYLARAKFWYVRALSASRGGAELEAAKGKLAFVAPGGTEYRPGLIAEYHVYPKLKERKKAQVELTVDVATRDHQALGPGLRVLWSGVLVPPAPGKYRLIADTPGTFEVRLHANAEANAVLTSRGAGRREAGVAFTGEKPVPVWVEYVVLPERRMNQFVMPNQTFTLRWVRPGAKAPEAVPPGVFFHPRKDSEKLTAGEK